MLVSHPLVSPWLLPSTHGNHEHTTITSKCTGPSTCVHFLVSERVQERGVELVVYVEKPRQVEVVGVGVM